MFDTGQQQCSSHLSGSRKAGDMEGERRRAPLARGSKPGEPLCRGSKGGDALKRGSKPGDALRLLLALSSFSLSLSSSSLHLGACRQVMPLMPTYRQTWACVLLCGNWCQNKVIGCTSFCTPTSALGSKAVVPERFSETQMSMAHC